MDHYILYLLLLLFGFFVGTFGTLIGVGGGFILMPVLLILYPNENPEVLTGISLTVVFFNALSGTIAYAKMKRIDYRSGILFALASLPGSIIGALSTAFIPRYYFNMIFGILLFCVAVFLLLYPKREGKNGEIVSARALHYSLSKKSKISGVILSLLVGFISSVLGIGGGIIHVPILIHILDFPVHFATATSHFILSIIAFTGTTVHFVEGMIPNDAGIIIALSVGALIGAQLGASLSKRIHGSWIVRGLAIGLVFVSIRLIVTAH